MLKKLHQIKFILIILQGVSIILLVFCYMFIKSNIFYIKNSDKYITKEIIIDSIYPSGGNSQKSTKYIAIGLTNNKKIHINIGYYRDNKNVSKKDTLPIWYNTLNGTGKKRLKKDKVFPKERYKKLMIKAIVFCILPIILLWFFSYKTSKKIKQLKIKQE